MTPLPNGDNGRGSNGQFTKGNAGGPGNPYARRAAELRAAMFDAVSPDDLRAVVGKLIEVAKGGDVAAAKLIFERTLGKSCVDRPPLSLEEVEQSLEERLKQHARITDELIYAVERIERLEVEFGVDRDTVNGVK